jgi:hypothetical protein
MIRSGEKSIYINYKTIGIAINLRVIIIIIDYQLVCVFLKIEPCFDRIYYLVEVV